MKVVIITIIISVTISLTVAAFVTLLGCCSYKVYVEREVNRVLDEERKEMKEHMDKVVKMAIESIRNTHLNK